MTSIKRRDFLKTAAATGAGVVLATSGVAPRATARGRTQSQEYRLFTTRTLPVPRPAENVEVLFQTPFPRANGMQAVAEGLWIVDPSDSASHVYLVSYDGEVLRDFPTEGDTPSGMTFDGEALWIASTYSREIIRVSAQDGSTLGTYFTPGAGVIFRMPGDPSSRRSPLAPVRTGRGGGQSGGGQQGGGPSGGGQDQHPGAFREGTGGHGMEWKDGKLWLATPPSRTIYRIDPETWTVEHMFPSVDKRPHGIGFEGDDLWEADADHATFYKRDPESGEVLEAIRLADEHPIPHGMTVRDGYIWWCDDVDNNSWVCRMSIA